MWYEPDSLRFASDATWAGIAGGILLLFAAITVWAELRRVKRRADRPLLKTADPAATVGRLIGEREPFYQQADLTIASRDVPHDKIVDECVDALHGWLCGGTAETISPDPLDATG